MDAKKLGLSLWPQIEQSVRNAKVLKKKEGCASVIQKYTPLKAKRMVDLIWKQQYDTSKISSSNLSLVWDHKRNDPKSVTAGIPGLHVGANISDCACG